MKGGSKTITGGVHYLLRGNAVFAISQWGVLVVLAKLSGAEAVGVYAFALAIALPIFSFTNLGLRSVVSTDAKYHFSSTSFFYLWCWLTLLAVFASILVSLLIGIYKVPFIILSAIILSRIAESGSFLTYGFFQREGKMDAISTSLILRGALGFFGILIVLYTLDSIALSLLSLPIVWLAVFVLWDMRNLSKLDLFIKSGYIFVKNKKNKEVMRLFEKALPLGVLALFTALTLHIPRYFIEDSYGPEALGYFAGITQLAGLGALIINSIGQTIVPKLARYYSTDKKNYHRLLGKSAAAAIIIGATGIIISVLIGGTILEIIYTAGFKRYEPEFIAAMFWSATLFISATVGNGLTAAHMFLTQSVIGFVSLIVTLLLSFLLIGQYGIMGAIIAMLSGVGAKLVAQTMIVFLST